MADVRQTLPEIVVGFKYSGYDSPSNNAHETVSPLHQWLTSVGQDGEISCPSSRCSISLPPTGSCGALQRPRPYRRHLGHSTVSPETAMSPHTIETRMPAQSPSRAHPHKKQSEISQRETSVNRAQALGRSGPPPPRE